MNISRKIEELEKKLSSALKMIEEQSEIIKSQSALILKQSEEIKSLKAALQLKIVKKTSDIAERDVNIKTLSRVNLMAKRSSKVSSFRITKRYL